MKKFFCLAIAAVFFASCSHNVKAPDVKTPIKLYVFDSGENMVKDISLFSPGVNVGKPKKLAATAYLIVHPNGMLMWDTGFPDALAKKKKGMSVRNGAFHIKRKKTLAAQLKEIGVDPKDVKYIAFSHMHFDHTGNANLFTNATVILQKEEYEAAFGGDSQKYMFDSSTYGDLKDHKAVKLSGDEDVFGDGSVIVLSTPGHTPGHQSLYIGLEKTGPIVISGDLYHFEDQRTYRRVPSFNFDKEETLKSMDKIEKFIADRKATLWIQHDLEQNRKIRHAPQFYE